VTAPRLHGRVAVVTAVVGLTRSVAMMLGPVRP